MPVQIAMIKPRRYTHTKSDAMCASPISIVFHTLRFGVVRGARIAPHHTPSTCVSARQSIHYYFYRSNFQTGFVHKMHSTPFMTPWYWLSNACTHRNVYFIIIWWKYFHDNLWLRTNGTADREQTERWYRFDSHVNECTTFHMQLCEDHLLIIICN